MNQIGNMVLRRISQKEVSDLKGGNSGQKIIKLLSTRYELCLCHCPL